MDINMKLYQPFVAAMNRNRAKYGEQMEKINGFHNSNLNFTDFIDNFVDTKVVADVTIDPNANSATHDINTLVGDMMKPHQKLLSFNKIFYEITKKYGLIEAEKWLENEWSGAFHLHDSSSASQKPYCFAYDLEDLMVKGLFFIDKFKTPPAQHLTTFMDHVCEFVSWNANRTSGAVGLPTLLYHTYYFWYKDVKDGYYLKDPETYRRQCFQKFIYDINQPHMRIVECAFTNVSIMDREYLTELFGGRVFPNGECAIDHIEGLIEHQKVFMEVVSEIRSKNMMTFPVLSYALLYKDGKFVDEEFAHWCSDHNSKWYDSNFMNANDVSIFSNCCRLLSDSSKLTGFINSIGGTALSIGSVKVNTINIRRVSLESGGDVEKFMEILAMRTLRCCEVLAVQRDIIHRNVEKGLLPNYTYGLIDFNKQYSTIGIIGIYEALCDFGLIATDKFGYKTYTDDAVAFVKRLFDTINLVKDNFKCDFTFNIECIPGESAARKLYEKDSIIYGDAAKIDGVLYSNQWIPLTAQCSMDEKIRLGSILDKLASGGQIAHINLESQISPEMHWNLLNKIAASGLMYFAFNPKISVCKNNHGFFGDICPECGEPVADYYSRIVGYLVPTKSYSAPRKAEFNERKWYKVE